MNASTFKSVSPTKFSVSSTSIDLPVKSRTSFKNLNLEIILDALSANNPFLTVMIGDFNAKSSNWYLNDVTSFEGSQIEFLASQFAMSQVINEPTHILDKSKFCIDLIFTSQPNVITNSGVHSSLHSNCHHQIISAKFDLKVFFPPLYERTVWHFSRANSDNIKKPST